MNLAEILDRLALECPDRTALIHGRSRITYRELAERSTARAHGYAEAGVGPGDRVVVGYGMGLSLYECLFALWRCGAAAVFLDPAQSEEHLRACLGRLDGVRMTGGWLARLWRLRASSVRGLPFLRPRTFPGLSFCVPLDKKDPALITFTSGSTGVPKGVVRTHGFLEAQHRVLEPALTLTPGEISLATLPVFALANLASGMTTVIAPGLRKGPGNVSGSALTALIRKEQVQSIVAAPAFYGQLLKTGERYSSVTKVFAGGAPVFPTLLDRLQKAFPAAEVVGVYGSSEAEPIAEIRADDLREADRATVRNGGGLPAGRPDPSIRIRLVEDEILVSGPQVLEGYLDGVGDTDNKVCGEDGTIWHRTGDAGRFDPEGRLWLLGRCAARQGDLFPFALEAAAVECGGVRLAGLAEVDGKRILAVQPTETGEPDREALDALCERCGVETWRSLDVPVDGRHQSKVDYPALMERLRNQD